MEVTCLQCGKKQSVGRSRAKTYKFCSYECRGKWRSSNFSGSNNPNWKGGVGIKQCKHCGKDFTHSIQAIFNKQKFCSKACADKGGLRYSGKDHPRWKGGARKRDGRQSAWAIAVISRDYATCQKCGVKGVEMHAHHITPYAADEAKRFDIGNGITLCANCHWQTHSAGNDNGVNSGELLTGGAEDNPEPSRGGNLAEGVTASGRAYRRWEGYCANCGAFVSKRLSSVKGNKRVFCSKRCSGLFNKNWRHRHPPRQ